MQRPIGIHRLYRFRSNNEIDTMWGWDNWFETTKVFPRQRRFCKPSTHACPMLLIADDFVIVMSLILFLCFNKFIILTGPRQQHRNPDWLILILYYRRKVTEIESGVVFAARWLVNKTFIYFCYTASCLRRFVVALYRLSGIYFTVYWYIKGPIKPGVPTSNVFLLSRPLLLVTIT